MRMLAAIAAMLLLASAVCVVGYLVSKHKPYVYAQPFPKASGWEAGIYYGRLRIGILSPTNLSMSGGILLSYGDSGETYGGGLIQHNCWIIRSFAGPRQLDEFWLSLGRWAIVLAGGGMGCLLWRQILSKRRGRRGFPVGAVEQRHV